MLKEFKEFISRGNVMDLAVGVIIGGAFSKIVSSLVNDVLMPFLGVLIGGIDFSALTIRVKDATISYGLFIQNIIDFLIISFCIFIIIKTINKLSKIVKREEEKEKAKEEVQPEPVSEEILLLREISASLKKNNSKKTKTVKKA